jgi:hypothetical protein
MQKSITNQFADMKKYMDTRFDEMINVQNKHENVINMHETRINFQNTRIENLENWKDEIENGAMFV